MSVSEYAYGVARLRAKRAFMLKPDDYEALLRAPTIHQALTHLRSVSDLAREIPQTESPHDIERHLLNKFAEIFQVLIKTLKGNSRAFLETTFNKYEYETLKALLKAKFLGLSEGEISLVAPPLGRYSGPLYASLLSTKGVDQAIDLIPDVELKLPLKEASKQAEALKNPLPFETAVDNLLFTKLWKLAGKLKMIDRKWVAHLLGVEADIKNILVLVRGKALGLQPSVIEKMLLPFCYKLPFNLKDLTSQSLASILQVLSSTYYGKALSSLAKDAIEIERALQSLWVKENETVFLHYPFTLGLFYAYINLKYVELKDVRAILLSKLAELPPQKVASLIIRHREKITV